MKYLGDSCLMSTRWAYIDTVTVTVSVQCALTSLHWLPHWYCAVMTVSVQCALRLCGGVCLRSVCIDTVTLTVSVQCGLILLHWLSSSVCIDTVLWWLSQFSVHFFFSLKATWACCCRMDIPALYKLSSSSHHAVVTVLVQCALILCYAPMHRYISWCSDCPVKGTDTLADVLTVLLKTPIHLPMFWLSC